MTLQLAHHNRRLLISITTCFVLNLCLLGFIFSLHNKAHGQSESSLPPGNGPWVVRGYFTSRDMVDALASRIEPWEVRPDLGYLVVAVERSQYLWMLKLGFRLEVDPTLTARLNRPNQALPGQVSGIPGYPCYRTVEETYSLAQNLVITYPNLASWIDIGDSWEKSTPDGLPGYDLRVLRLTNSQTSGPKPKLFIMASMHPREYAPAELNTRFAEYLLQNYNTNADVTWLLDYHEIHFLLQANPDGRNLAEAGLWWRKNTNSDYCTNAPEARGADLNRNFDFQWGCCGGSSTDQCDETYRGLTKASEPETQAVQDYLRGIFPDQREASIYSPTLPTATGIFLDLHSFSERVLWPWGFTDSTPPNGQSLQTLGRKLAYYNNYLPTQSIVLYVTDGTTDDFAYGDLGLAAYTFELGNTFFQDCATFENDILPNNIPALLYAAKASRFPYLLPAGPDVISPTLSLYALSPGTLLTLTALLDDTRYQISFGVEPTQPISTAEYYINTPPWITTTTPIPHPLLPLDGVFNSTIETAQSVIDTAGLDFGRHTIYIRGQDQAGNWGPVSAVFFLIARLNYYLPIINR